MQVGHAFVEAILLFYYYYYFFRFKFDFAAQWLAGLVPTRRLPTTCRMQQSMSRQYYMYVCVYIYIYMHSHLCLLNVIGINNLAFAYILLHSVKQRQK